MRKGWKTVLAAVALAATAGAARAGYIEFDSSVVLTPVSPFPLATLVNGSEMVSLGAYSYPAPNVTLDGGSGNSVTITGLATNPAPPHANANGAGTDIVFGRIAAESLGPAESFAFDYVFTLNLSDYATPTSAAALGSGSIQISGRISGTLGDYAINLGNSLYKTNPPSGLVTLSNGATYQVTVDTFTKPGMENFGTFGAHVQAVPEPGTLMAMGGVLGVLGMRRRKK
jgi:hypothetical protein